MSNRPTQPDRDLARAIARLREGGVVAFPTETVYGLGANALDPIAVARVFEIKVRPRFDPLIVHVATIESARALFLRWPDSADRLARRFWPGPLTIVLEKRASIPDIVTAGLPTVGVRVPDHPLALALLAGAGVPIAAPSANRFGAVSPTTAEHVRESLGGQVDLILDGGPCRTGVESTVISLVGEPALLRPGGVPREEVEEVVGPLRHESQDAGGGSTARPSPGMLASHYATRTPLEILGTESSWKFTRRPVEGPAERPAERLGFIGVRRPEALAASQFDAIEELSPSGDLREAAANLFAAMRRLDALALDRILALVPGPAGLGAAIADRLTRAARS